MLKACKFPLRMEYRTYYNVPQRSKCFAVATKFYYERKAANDAMDKVSKDISVLAEGYPELKANTNFVD